MKGKKRKISATSLALLILCMLLTTALALAYIRYWQIQTTFHVKPHGFKIYEDQACTTEFTSWDLGSLEMLNTSERVHYKVIYAKNFEETETFPLNVTWFFDDLVVDSLTPLVVGELPSGVSTVSYDSNILFYISVSYNTTSFVIWNALNHTSPETHELYGVCAYRLYIEFTADYPSDAISSFDFEFIAESNG